MDKSVLNYDITNLVKQHTCVNHLASWFEAPANLRKIHLFLKTFYFFVFFCSGAAFSQPNKTTKAAPNSIGTAGNQAKVGNVTYMWSVGEVIIFTGDNQPGYFTQGFHQPMMCKAIPSVSAFNQTSCLLPYTLTVTAGFDRYSWKIGKSLIANATASAYYPIANGDYIATVMDSTGCVLPATAVAVDLSSKNIIPTITAYGGTANDTLLESSMAFSYQWYVITPSDNIHRAIVGQTNREYKPIYNGTYYVSINTEDQCISYSPYYTVNNVGLESISKHDFEQTDNTIIITKHNRYNAHNLKVFPIPSRDKLNIEYESPFKNTVVFNIYDVKGVLVDTRSIANAEGKLNFVYSKADLPIGRYTLRVVDGNKESDKGLIFE